MRRRTEWSFALKRRFHVLRMLSKISAVIQAFLWLKYVTRRLLLLIFLKHLGFSDLQITMSFSFSPAAFTSNATVIRCLVCFPPLHFLPVDQILDLVGLSKNNLFHQNYRYFPLCIRQNHGQSLLP